MLYRLESLTYTGAVTTPLMIEALVAMPMVFLGVWIGVYIFDHIPERIFQWLVLVLLAVNAFISCSRQLRKSNRVQLSSVRVSGPLSVHSVQQKKNNIATALIGVQFGRQSGAHHVPTALGAFRKDLGTDLAVIGIVAPTLFSTLLTGIGTSFGQLRAVVGAASHESGMQRRDICNIATEPGTLFHLLVAETLVSTPLTDLSGFVADLDALALFVGQMIDLGDCFGKRHYTSPYEVLLVHWPACPCVVILWLCRGSTADYRYARSIVMVAR